MSSLPSISLYKRIAVGFVSIAVVLVLVLVYFSAGKAVVKIEPKKRDYQTNFLINIGRPSTDTGSLANFVSGKVLKMTIEDKKTFSTTGKKQAEVAIDTKSVKTTTSSNIVGKITVKNDSSQSYNFIVKTRFLSADGILFRMQKPATIPANGSTEVEVYPDDAKFTGTLAPTSFTIPGLKEETQKLVYGVTTSPLTSSVATAGSVGSVSSTVGGEVYFLTEEDITKARADLLEQLKQQALLDLSKNLKFREKIFGNASDVKIVEEKLSKKVGDIGKDFELSLKIEVVAVSLNEQDLADEIQIKIKEKLPVGTELIDFNPNLVKYEMEKYDDVSQLVSFKVTYIGSLIVNADNEIFNKESLMGQTKEEVVNSLSKLPDVKSVSVDLSPFWVKHVPNMSDRIEMILVK